MLRFLFIFLFSTNFALAANFGTGSWRTSNSNNWYYASSPKDSCDMAINASIYSSRLDREYSVSPSTPQAWLCRVYTSGRTSFVTFQANFVSCPADTTFNPVTGLCDPPEPNPCEARAGTSRPFSKIGIAPDSYVSISGGYAIPQQAGCFEGCAASTSDQKCTTRVLGTYYCKGTAWFTGAQCGTSSDPVVDPTESAAYPDPQTIIDEKPCTYTSNADGSKGCESVKVEEKEGQQCGQVNGERICLDKPPQKNGINISTTVNEVINPDGSKSTTKTDTATITKCTGVNECKTTTTTKTTVTKTDGAGNTTGVSGSCTGPACPDKNTNPDGNGDGFGDCVGDKCSEDGSSVGGEGCDAPLQCTGDAIQCAILSKEKALYCHQEEQSDFEGHKTEIEGLFQGEKFTLDEGDDIEIPSFINQGTRFLNPSCPPDRSVSLSFKSVSVSFEPLCDFASALGPLIVAFTAVFCALYIGRSVGGN